MIARVMKAAEETGVKDNLTVVVLFGENFHLKFESSNIFYFDYCLKNLHSSKVISHQEAAVESMSFEYGTKKSIKRFFECCIPFFK